MALAVPYNESLEERKKRKGDKNMKKRIEIELPETLDEARQNFGDEYVLKLFIAEYVKRLADKAWKEGR